MLPFIALSAWVFVLLARVFVARLHYPLDLEWMEGGTLVHALRLARGQPLYAEPSVDFVSFLYTPLYPAVLAALSKLFGLSYALGRAVSLAAFAGALAILVVAARGVARQFESEELQPLGTTAGLLAAAAVCAAYPFCGAFYDLVRGDSLWLFLVAAGLCSSAPSGAPSRSLPRLLLGALLLTLGFLTKQTAAPFVVAAAASVAVTAGLRRGLLFAATALGMIGTATLAAQQLTHGWFWIYVYRLHQSHQTDLAKIWPETPSLLVDYGALLVLPIIACLPMALLRRRLSRALFHWSLMAAAGLVTAALGSATQGAFDNAYIPAVYFGALLAAASVVELSALAGRLRASASGRVWGVEGPSSPGVSLRVVGLLGLALLSAHLWLRWPDLTPQVPTARDFARASGLRSYLVAQGPELFVPCHPFYSVLAGGRGHLHVMGLNDADLWAPTITGDSTRDAAIRARFRESLVSSFRSERWRAVLLDDCATPSLLGLETYYRFAEDLARSGKAPRTLTGYRCAPRYLWLPRRSAP